MVLKARQELSPLENSLEDCASAQYAKIEIWTQITNPYESLGPEAQTKRRSNLLEIGVRSGGVWKVGVTGTLKLSGRWN